MDKKITCQIVIEDIIKRHLIGFVKIFTPGEVIIQCAYIEIIGCASCEFALNKTVMKFPTLYRKGIKMKGDQQFYMTRHTLCGGNLAHKHKGAEGYEFTCGWPTRLPATWYGEHGHIKYIGKVSIIGISGDLYIHSQDILVQSHRDLLLEKHLLFESMVTIERKFIGKMGSINISVWLPFSGIAVKQSIPVVCSVSNDSDIPFGGLIFVLTRIEIYRSHYPINVTKTVRTDICRVPKMVNILRGRTDYYCVLETNEDTLPTNQFYRCHAVQIIYEVWVSLQGAFPRYRIYGYPNIDTPGIPIIIGTDPVCSYNPKHITAAVMNNLLKAFPTADAESLPPDDEVEELLNTVEDELDNQTIENLNRQLEEDEKAIKELTE